MFDKKKLKKRVSGNKIREILDELMFALEVDNPLSNELAALSAKFERLSEKSRQGTLNDPENKEFTKLNHQLLEVIDRLPVAPHTESFQGKQDCFNAELISILEERAEEVDLSSFPVLQEKFKVLHKKHITAVKKNNLIHAHDILGRIHKLIFNYHITMIEREYRLRHEQEKKVSFPIFTIKEATAELETERQAEVASSLPQTVVHVSFLDKLDQVQHAGNEVLYSIDPEIADCLFDKYESYKNIQGTLSPFSTRGQPPSDPSTPGLNVYK